MERDYIEKIIKKNMGNTYSLGALLGTGGYAKGDGGVYELLGGKEELAVKILSCQNELELASQLNLSPAVKRVRRKEYLKKVNQIRSEISILSRLRNSKDVTQLTKSFEACSQKKGEPDLFFIVQKKYVCLSEYMRDHKMTEQVAFKIAKDICNALIVLDRNKIIHRDVKPDNLFVQLNKGEFECVLGDFGIAREGTLDSSMIITRIGTPEFVAPEIEHGEKRLARNSDIYSLGATLYYILSGKFVKKIQEEKKKIPSLPISKEFEKIILKCVSWECENRYRDAKELLKELESLTKDEPKPYNLTTKMKITAQKTLTLNKGINKTASIEKSQQENEADAVLTWQEKLSVILAGPLSYIIGILFCKEAIVRNIIMESDSIFWSVIYILAILVGAIVLSIPWWFVWGIFLDTADGGKESTRKKYIVPIIKCIVVMLIHIVSMIYGFPPFLKASASLFVIKESEVFFYTAVFSFGISVLFFLALFVRTIIRNLFLWIAILVGPLSYNIGLILCKDLEVRNVIITNSGNNFFFAGIILFMLMVGAFIFIVWGFVVFELSELFSNRKRLASVIGCIVMPSIHIASIIYISPFLVKVCKSLFKISLGEELAFTAGISLIVAILCLVLILVIGSVLDGKQGENYDIKKLYDEAKGFREEDLEPMGIGSPQNFYKWGWIKLMRPYNYDEGYSLALISFHYAAKNGDKKGVFVYELWGNTLKERAFQQETESVNLGVGTYEDKWTLYQLYNQAELFYKKNREVSNAVSHENRDSDYMKAWEAYFSKDYLKAWKEFTRLRRQQDKRAIFIRKEWERSVFRKLILSNMEKSLK